MLGIQIIRIIMLITAIILIIPIIIMAYGSIFFGINYTEANTTAGVVMILTGASLLLCLTMPTKYRYKI